MLVQTLFDCDQARTGRCPAVLRFKARRGGVKSGFPGFPRNRDFAALQGCHQRAGSTVAEAALDGGVLKLRGADFGVDTGPTLVDLFTVVEELTDLFTVVED